MVYEVVLFDEMRRPLPNRGPPSSKGPMQANQTATLRKPPPPYPNHGQAVLPFVYPGMPLPNQIHQGPRLLDQRSQRFRSQSSLSYSNQVMMRLANQRPLVFNHGPRLTNQGPVSFTNQGPAPFTNHRQPFHSQDPAAALARFNNRSYQTAAAARFSTTNRCRPLTRRSAHTRSADDDAAPPPPPLPSPPQLVCTVCKFFVATPEFMARHSVVHCTVLVGESSTSPQSDDVTAVDRARQASSSSSCSHATDVACALIT